MPADDDVRLHEHERVLPSGPALSKEHPEDAVSAGQLRTLAFSPYNRELLLESDVLDHQVDAAPDRGAERAKEGREDATHGA